MQIRLHLPLVLLLASLGCQESPRLQLRTYSNIVFLSNRESPKRQFDIFLMNLDGSGQTNLSKGLQSIRSISRPILSPDQKSVLFVAFEGDRITLKIMDRQRSTVAQIAEVGFETPQASFSPNGDNVLFVKKIDGRRQIHVARTDGAGERNLSSNDHDEHEPCYSPDGSKIAFVSNKAGLNSIWIMNPDGTDRESVADQTGNCGRPSFSPDGRKVVFHARRNGRSAICLLHLASNSVRVLHESKANNVDPQFSPDGRKILFVSNERGMKYQDVYTYDLVSKKIAVVSYHINFINQNAKFSPDGKRIVFESVQFDNAEIYIVDADGQNLKNLTNNPKWDCSPSF